jgi:hypothetical protein
MDSVLAWWRHFVEHAQFWDAFWPAVWGALVGAVAATLLERRYRVRERISKEVGECNKLIFILGQMLSTLEDINESLFVDRRKELGRDPEWDDIGALVGAPTQGPAFIIGEYTFLLEDDDPNSMAPAMLGRVYTAESNFKEILARLDERSLLWNQFLQYRGPTFARGEEFLARMNEAAPIIARLKELTRWLAEDLPEAIALLKALVPNLREVLQVRYPKRRFVRLWPTEDRDAPPL